MGIETLIAAASVATSAASSVMQRNQAKKVAQAQREGRDIQQASEERQNILARRRAAREARIRRARIAQASANQGTQGSSSEAGSQAALGANFGASAAAQSGQAAGAKAISKTNQAAADASFKQQQIGAYGELAQQGFGFAYKYKTGNDLF